MNLQQSFFVRPGAHERVETIVHLQEDRRPALLGTVHSETGRPVQDALVTVYRSGRADEADQPVGVVYTDALGRFAFGPLEPDELYQIQVFKNGATSRVLEQPLTSDDS
ncbi:MAG: carboxypeptidase-like regulatory domain-containing protein [Butyricicoccus sp.]|nr:carboxypeptidase-like regulatory domain-containing protein [Butyricicoccus sp.]